MSSVPASSMSTTSPLSSEAAAKPTTRRRLLFVLTSTAGGVGQQAYYLLRHLDRSRFDVTVAFGLGYPLDASFDQLGYPVVHLSSKRTLAPVSNLRALVQIYRLMRRERFDAVCTQQSMAGMLGRLAGWLAGVPHRLHVIHVYACHEHQPPLKRWVYRCIERLLDRVTTRYVAVSQATRDYGVAQGLFEGDRVEVIYNGIPDRTPASGIRRTMREEWGVGADAPLVLTAGRFEPQKAIDQFIEAAARVARDIPAARFVIVGDGPDRERLETLTRERGISDRVVFTGWRDDVQATMACADLFVLSSRWEALPLTIAEAMSAGCAVVATDVGGVREMIEDGESGRVVPSDDPGVLADAMRQMLDDDEARQACARRGRERFEAQFRLDAMVGRYDRFLIEQTA